MIHYLSHWSSSKKLVELSGQMASSENKCRETYFYGFLTVYKKADLFEDVTILYIS